MQTEISKRSVDGKHVVWKYMADPCFVPDENEAKLGNDMLPYVSFRWVMVGVHDEHKDAQAQQRTFTAKYGKKA